MPIPVVVLGAGLQGASIALELARRGVPVTLVDQDPLPFNRASLRNEGKIHLGLVYANDRTLATGRLQLEGALRFRALLSRWIGDAADALAVSTPFHYLVAHDSVLAPAELAEYYEALERVYHELIAGDPDLDYLGTRPARLFHRADLAETSDHLRPDAVQAAFATSELAIDTLELAQQFRAAIARAPLIDFRGGLRVEGVTPAPGGFNVGCTGGAGPATIAARQVVNATWEGRLAIDRTAGIEPSPGWLHRLKYRVIARLPASLRDGPSVTMVLGRYGDVVVRPDGTAYLSWYPAGLGGWSSDLAPPGAWDAPCKGEPDAATAAAMCARFIPAIARWYPGIADAEPFLVDAGAIVAYGSTDVDDRASGLHDRTRVGVTSRGPYHSVDGGKLTTIPMFAMQAADRVHELRERGRD